MCGRLVCTVVLALALTGRPSQAQGSSPAGKGALIGGPIGGAAGLLFAHDSCDGDPCTTGAFVVAAAAGGALFAGLGAVLASRVTQETSGRGARNGAIIGGLLGAIGGVLLILTTCESDECGPAGYAALGLTGAAAFATVGSMVGDVIAGTQSELRLLGWKSVPLLGLSPRGAVIGIRAYD